MLKIAGPIAFDPLSASILRLPRRSSCPTLIFLSTRPSSSSSSSKSRWIKRLGQDAFAREARVQGLKSRAAFKLLEIDTKFAIFRPNQTVVDLGYAPGSWSQVALQRTRPNGRVIGIDLVPAQPPPGVATFQGDFLSPRVRQMVKTFIVQSHFSQAHLKHREENPKSGVHSPVSRHIDKPSYIDIERRTGTTLPCSHEPSINNTSARLVDVVMSDMSAPWDQTSGFNSKCLSNPYNRLMNTSGIGFRDHAGSMSLCTAALQFANDTLKIGGHLICKFYQGSEDRLLENELKKLFAKVYREKPESSRSESKEAYFIALRRRVSVDVPCDEGNASIINPVRSG